MKLLSNFKTITLFVTILFSQWGFAQPHHMTDAPSVHGMLLFGQDKIYLSHLPMFHNPHDYQVLFEVEISEFAKSKYLQSIENDPSESVYTIVPESFVLPDIAKNPKSFKAQLFKGHFERGGSPITNVIEFKINKVLYFKKFVPNTIKPQMSSYILIGNEKEQFLIHTVVAKPDFDYVTKVKIENNIVKKDISKINHLMITIDSSNEQPLKVGQNYTGVTINNLTSEVELHISKSLYLEFGDLSF
ncbi:hypothetical protein OAB57_01065 [Bacteriovoracaceae bacterium]|nr:hypothetical protein [Bacteriovoracaceae bacterium]